MRTELKDNNDIHNVIHIDKGNTFISPGANCSLNKIASLSLYKNLPISYVIRRDAMRLSTFTITYCVEVAKKSGLNYNYVIIKYLLSNRRTRKTVIETFLCVIYM